MNAFHLFTLANVPVRVSGGYLILLAYFGWIQSKAGIAYALVAGLCITISLLVHEFGHALVAKRQNLAPQVVLHGWGGLTFHGRAKSDKHDAFIIAAGPLSGLAFGGLVYLVATFVPIATLIERPLFAYSLEMLIYINVFWSLYNLVPLWPLDGGQLFRLAMLRFFKPVKAERITHIVGIALAVVAVAVAVLIWKSIFVGIIGVSLLFENLKHLQTPAASGPIRTRNTRADELLAESARFLREGDGREALRLAFQVKEETNLSDSQLEAVWVLLTVASAKVSAWDDTLHYSIRAPRLPPVFAARVRALAALGRRREARAELEAGDAPVLPEPERRALEALLADGVA